jgi:hypothetical protein
MLLLAMQKQSSQLAQPTRTMMNDMCFCHPACLLLNTSDPQSQDVGVMPAEFAATLAASLSKPDSLYCQAENGQYDATLGQLEISFVQRCMGTSEQRPPPCLMLKDDPYLSSRYRGG